MTQDAAPTIDVDSRERAVIQGLLRHHLPDVGVWAYGSRVRWNARPQSDLDLVAFASPEQRGAVLQLREVFEESSLPFSVDLLIWDDLPESFHRNIEANYVVVQGGKSQRQNEERGKVVLGDVAEIVMGQSPTGDTVSDKQGLALLNGPTEFGAHHPIPVQFTTDARKRAQPGDILFCVRGSTTGRMNWADQEYAIGRGVAAIRHRENPSLQPFVRGVIDLELPALLSWATGSTFPNVSSSQLAEIPYPNLDKAEQRRIAHILGTLDDKIELNRRMNQTLEAMARAIFQDWFVDFGPVRAKLEGREPHLPPELWDLFPDRLVDSELGEIPEGWAIGQFSDVVTQLRDNENPAVSPGIVFSHFSIPAYDEGQTPKRELGGSIKSTKSRVHRDTVLISKLNPEIRRVWLVDVVPNERAICSTEFLVFKATPPFQSSYVYCLALSPFFRQQIESVVTGTSKSHQRAPADAVLSLEVVIPHEQVIGAFVESVSELFRSSMTHRRESRSLAAQRDALLPRLISGELRV